MKKEWIAVLTAALCMTPITISAEGLEVTEKNFIEFTGDDTAYFFAKVENNGNEAVNLGSGKLVGFSETDDLIITEEYITTLPSYITLNPGEYVYAREYIWDSALEDADVVDYKFSMETRERDTEESMTIIPCEVEKDFQGNLNNYIVVTFSNDTDEILYDYFITVAMHDDLGNLIFADGDGITTLGLHPGAKVSLKMYVDNAFFEYFGEKGFSTGSAEAQVFVLK